MEWKDIERRIGKFEIDGALVRERPSDVLLVMSKMVIIRAEHEFYRDRFTYMAFSMLFDKVEEGTEPPEYSIWIGMVGNDLEVSAVK